MYSNWSCFKMSGKKILPLLILSSILNTKSGPKIEIDTHPIMAKKEKSITSKRKLMRIKGKNARKNRGKRRLK